MRLAYGSSIDAVCDSITPSQHDLQRAGLEQCIVGVFLTDRVRARTRNASSRAPPVEMAA